MEVVWFIHKKTFETRRGACVKVLTYGGHFRSISGRSMRNMLASRGHEINLFLNCFLTTAKDDSKPTNRCDPYCRCMYPSIVPYLPWMPLKGLFQNVNAGHSMWLEAIIASRSELGCKTQSLDLPSLNEVKFEQGPKATESKQVAHSGKIRSIHINGQKSPRWNYTLDQNSAKVDNIALDSFTGEESESGS